MLGRPPSIEPEMVRRVRQWYALRKETRRRIEPSAKELAREAGVSTAMVYLIGSGGAYRWVQ